VRGDTVLAAVPKIGLPHGFCGTGWDLLIKDGMPIWRCPDKGEATKKTLDLPVAKGGGNRLGVRQELVWLTEMDRDKCAADNHGYDSWGDPYQESLLRTDQPIQGRVWHLWNADCAKLEEEDQKICIQGQPKKQGRQNGTAPTDGKSCLLLWHQKMRARMMCERRMHFTGSVCVISIGSSIRVYGSAVLVLYI
jgi:hypothetical protein